MANRFITCENELQFEHYEYYFKYEKQQQHRKKNIYIIRCLLVCFTSCRSCTLCIEHQKTKIILNWLLLLLLYIPWICTDIYFSRIP